MIPYKNRFHGHGSLDYTYRNGQTTRSHLVNIKTTTNKKRSQSRIAVVIGKKVVKSAVKRNQARRKVYEYIRPKMELFDQVRDVVIIIASSELISLPHDQLSSQLDQLLQQSGIISK